MRTSSVSAKAHNEAAKKLRELADEIGQTKLADKLGKHVSHICHVLSGRRTMSEEVCNAVMALHEKVFMNRVVQQVTKAIEASKATDTPKKRKGKQPSASPEIQRQAINKLKELNETIGLKKLAPKLGFAYGTLYAGMREAQGMSAQLCAVIIAFDSETAKPEVIAETPKGPKTVHEKKIADLATKGFTASRTAQLNVWTGKLSKEQAERIQVIARHCAHRIGRGRDSFNGFSIEDLEQAGVVECVARAKRFDPKVSQFNTFFNIAAQSGIRDFMREIDLLSRGERVKVKSGSLADVKVLHIEDFGTGGSNNDNVGNTESFQIPYEDKRFDDHDDAQLLDAIVEEAKLTDDEALVLDMHKLDMSQKDIGTMFSFSESRANQVVMAVIEKLIMAKNRMVDRERDVQNG